MPYRAAGNFTMEGGWIRKELRFRLNFVSGVLEMHATFLVSITIDEDVSRFLQMEAFMLGS